MGDEKLPQLNPGDIIRQHHKIVEKLGDAGADAVYMTEDAQTGEKYATKIGSPKDPIQSLIKEVVLLEKVRERIAGRHVCKIFDKGRNASFNQAFNYVVMTLVGQSLQDLCKACPAQKFSTGTALRVGIQCLEALEDLHKIGYLHRDVKPGSFAIGREELKEQRIVYILDFSLAWMYISERLGLIRRRLPPTFRGPVRYAPLSCHNREEAWRKSDLEMWFYQQIEITKGKVPWSTVEDKDEVARYKVQSRGTGEMIQDTPPQYGHILTHIDSLKHYDLPDYTLLYRLLREAMKEGGCEDTDPYDWEVGGEHRQLTQILPPPAYNPHGDAPHVDF